MLLSNQCLYRSSFVSVTVAGIQLCYPATNFLDSELCVVDSKLATDRMHVTSVAENV
jgi:hypothetical protein